MQGGFGSDRRWGQGAWVHGEQHGGGLGAEAALCSSLLCGESKEANQGVDGDWRQGSGGWRKRSSGVSGGGSGRGTLSMNGLGFS